MPPEARRSEDGKETIVFSCFNQDQELDHVDFKHLNDAPAANTMQEKLAAASIAPAREVARARPGLSPDRLHLTTPRDGRRRGSSRAKRSRPGRLARARVTARAHREAATRRAGERRGSGTSRRSPS